LHFDRNKAHSKKGSDGFIKHISWAEFFANVVIVAVLYYITVVIMYFRKDLPQYLPKQFKPVARSVSFTAPNKATEEPDIFSLAGKAAAAIKQHTRDVAARPTPILLASR
jgi:hypothetical protein